MEFTKFFAQINNDLGLFPGLKQKEFARMMNIVALEARIDTLRKLRSVKPEEVFNQSHRSELEYYKKLQALHHNALPEHLFQSLVLDSYPQPLEYYMNRSEIQKKILNLVNEKK